jgi:DNA sulfur modification protein DndB
MEMIESGIVSKIYGTGYTQFGKKVLVTQLRFSALEAIFEIDPEVQRKLDPRRRLEIREFIINSIITGNYFYFSPFIFSARGQIKETDDGWELTPGCKIYTLDGQHRSAAMSSAISHLKAQKDSAEELSHFDKAEQLQKYIDKLRAYPVAMQVYLDLTQKEEKQLFTDINTERREAHAGLIMQYDRRDQYAVLARKIAEKIETKFEIEQKLSRLTYQNSAVTSLAIMRRCLLALFEGILTVKTGEPNFRNCKEEEVEKIALAFFESWSEIFPKQMANRKRYVSGLTGIQVALAFTVFQLTKHRSMTHLEAIHLMKTRLKNISWLHDDPLFSHLYDSASRRIKNHSSTTAIAKTALKFQVYIEKERQ